MAHTHRHNSTFRLSIRSWRKSMGHHKKNKKVVEFSVIQCIANRFQNKTLLLDSCSVDLFCFALFCSPLNETSRLIVSVIYLIVIF